jgi:DNA-binding transcriptional MerR regulator
VGSDHGADTDFILEAENGNSVETFGQMVRANDLQRVERRNRILRLRRQGFTYDDISQALASGADDGEAFEVSPQSCQRAVVQYIAELSEEDVESVQVLRHIDNERLERLFKSLELDRRDPDGRVRVSAARAQLKVLERHSKLNGLDAPEVKRIEGDVNHHVVADPDHVQRVDEGFRRRHGGDVLELPVPENAREVK